MSQKDEVRCPICNELVGQDEKAIWWGDGGHRRLIILCRGCKRNLASEFCAFFGLDSQAARGTGIEIEWYEIVRILMRIRRNHFLRFSYLPKEGVPFLPTEGVSYMLTDIERAASPHSGGFFVDTDKGEA